MIDPAPMVVAIAPNGARRNKADHPAVPLTHAELARDAAACHERGATLLHLHVRDGAGRHSLDADLYRDAIQAIRREAGPELIIQITTEAIGRFTPREQMAAVRAIAPEAVSLAIRELVPDPTAETTAAGFLEECVHQGRLMQYILYSPEDLVRLAGLVARGVVPEENASVLFVLGRYPSREATRAADLEAFLRAQAAHGAGSAPWFVCAFGSAERACALAAAGRGGHARVGFENNVLLADGRVAPGNAGLVVELVEALPATGRTVATAAQARAILSGSPVHRACGA
jgi:uncharacterized protein (DUF849 family)